MQIAVVLSIQDSSAASIDVLASLVIWHTYPFPVLEAASK